MTSIEFKIEEKSDYTIVHFELKGPLAPADLREVAPPQVKGVKGVILSGRGPIWLYCFLAHNYHPTKFIATYDPRLGGAVIVESHSSEFREGEVIELENT